MFDFDNFDVADAAVFGGVVGFVEEAAKSEEYIDENTLNEATESYIESSSDQTMRLLYNQNPSLVRHLIYLAYKSRKKISKANQEEMADIKDEIDAEIEYLRKLESE